MLTEGF
jgi:ABC-type bacteriocin/lantibiotic exporter with double-glycine peptidase domain